MILTIVGQGEISESDHVSEHSLGNGTYKLYGLVPATNALQTHSKFPDTAFVVIRIFHLIAGPASM